MSQSSDRSPLRPGLAQACGATTAWQRAHQPDRTDLVRKNVAAKPMTGARQLRDILEGRQHPGCRTDRRHRPDSGQTRRPGGQAHETPKANCSSRKSHSCLTAADFTVCARLIPSLHASTCPTAKPSGACDSPPLLLWFNYLAFVLANRGWHSATPSGPAAGGRCASRSS